jgi:hypothetical protein
MLKFFNENHMQVIAIVLLCAAGIWFYGCESKVQSLTNPAVKVGRSELMGEVDAFLATAKAREMSLDEQDALRKKILDNAALFAQGGQMNPMGAINTLVSIFAVGSALDSRRKLKNVIAERVTPADAGPSTNPPV